MPWKLLLFLSGISLLIAFAGFNLDHVSSLSFGFLVLKDVPIFYSLAVSFLTGGVVFLFLFRVKKKNEKNPPAE